MKSTVYLLGLSTLLFCSLAVADIEYYDWAEGYPPDETPQVDHFWEINANGDWLTPADVTTRPFPGKKVKFYQAEAELAYTQLLGCQRDAGLRLGLGYANTGIHLDDNPSFRQDTFDNFIVNIGGFSAHYPGWLWKANIGAWFDLNHDAVAHYTLYTGMLWGRYSLCPNIGIHMGMLAATGIRKDKTWPIIGIDYQWNERVKINLVYPVDISASYLITECWSVGVAERFWWTRHRVSSKEPLPSACVEYRNTGTEARLSYIYDPIVTASVHAGYAYGQDVIIGNKRGHQNTHYKFDGSGYIGGDLNLKF